MEKALGTRLDFMDQRVQSSPVSFPFLWSSGDQCKQSNDSQRLLSPKLF